MKCQVCTQETMLPFRCPFCGGQFCSVHRLPENHSCPGISKARTHVQDKVMTQQAYNSYNYSYALGQDPYKRKYRIRWSQKEFKHIGIAAALVLGIGFSIGLYSNFFGGFAYIWRWDVMAVFALLMTASFLVHEIAHKVMAQKSGMWAEFRLTTWGAMLTLVSVFLPFKMISPGAMMIGGTSPTKENMIKISIAGVITNMILATTFLGLGFALLSIESISRAFISMLFFAAYINAFMALFNLIPFGVLDGYKIFSLNKTIWVAAFIPGVILTVFTYWLIFGF
jgi:Zn-dependent protease